MAQTYTDRLELAKDDGDESLLSIRGHNNSNLDIIDDFAEEISDNIADFETNPATSNHSAGTYFMLENTLHRAKTAIASGESITSSNAEPITIAEVLNTLNGNVSTLQDSVGTAVVSPRLSRMLFTYDPDNPAPQLSYTLPNGRSYTISFRDNGRLEWGYWEGGTWHSVEREGVIDLNSITTTGFSYVYNASANLPVQNNGGMLITVTGGGGSTRVQAMVPLGRGELYLRFFGADKWSEWRKLYCKIATIDVGNVTIPTSGYVQISSSKFPSDLNEFLIISIGGYRGLTPSSAALNVCGDRIDHTYVFGTPNANVTGLTLRLLYK